jgi:hypothetical protein
MEILTNHSIPLKRSDVAWQMVEGEAVVLHISGQMLRGLNAVASHIWQLIDGNRTLESIAQQVSTKFSRGEEEVLEDVKTFMVELLEKNMVTFSHVTTSHSYLSQQ